MHSVREAGGLVSGRYRLDRPMGRGAMGIVWRARDELLDREVAVKEIRIAWDDGVYQRTLREAKAAARLSHPGVVTVFDVVEEDGRPWIVMELVPARSLDRLIAEDGPLRPLAAARVGAGLLGALACAHAAGVLHRDVKPGNVLVGPDDAAVLTDFGIATFPGDPALTQAGMVVGTPGFTAPERVRGGPASPASDLWSLGATLYAAVEGRGPFDRPGGAAAISAGVIAEGAPRAPSAGPLAGVIDALLRADPAQRPDAAAAASLLADAAAAASAGPACPGVLPVTDGAPAFGDIREIPVLPPEQNLPANAGQMPFGGPHAPGEPPTVLDPRAGLRGQPAFADPVGPAGPDPVRRAGPDPVGPAFADLVGQAGPDPVGRAGASWLPPAAGSGAIGPVAAGPAVPVAGGPALRAALPAAGGPALPAAGRSGRRTRPRRGRRARLPALAAAAIAVAAAAGLVTWAAGQHPVNAAPIAGTAGSAPPGGSTPESAREARQAPAARTPRAAGTRTRAGLPASGTAVGSGRPGGTATGDMAGEPAGYLWYQVTPASTGTTAGFGIAAPATWVITRQWLATYLKPPAGLAYIEINLAPFGYLPPLDQAVFLQAQALAQERYPGYRRIAIAAGEFLGVPDAIWRFRWGPGGAGGRADVLELLTSLTTAGGTQSYALTVSAPRADFPEAEAVFLRVLATFRPLP